MHKTHPLAWQAPLTTFARTHCMRCEAGWTRSGQNGTRVIVCLLDREPVLNTMTDCDRFEPRVEVRHRFDQTAKRTTRK